MGERLRKTLVDTIENTKEVLLNSCNSDHALLWDVFVKFDESLDARVDTSELRDMLQCFDEKATDVVLNSYVKAIDTQEDGLIEFDELVAWWERSKGGEHGEVLKANMDAKFTALKVQNVWELFTGNPIRKRIGDMKDSQVEKSVTEYLKVSAQVRQWCACGYEKWSTKQQSTSHQVDRLHMMSIFKPKSDGSSFLSTLHTFYELQQLADEELDARQVLEHIQLRAVGRLCKLVFVLNEVNVIVREEARGRTELSASGLEAFCVMRQSFDYELYYIVSACVAQQKEAQVEVLDAQTNSRQELEVAAYHEFMFLAEQEKCVRTSLMLWQGYDAVMLDTLVSLEKAVRAVLLQEYTSWMAATTASSLSDIQHLMLTHFSSVIAAHLQLLTDEELITREAIVAASDRELSREVSLLNTVREEYVQRSSIELLNSSVQHCAHQISNSQIRVCITNDQATDCLAREEHTERHYLDHASLLLYLTLLQDLEADTRCAARSSEEVSRNMLQAHRGALRLEHEELRSRIWMEQEMYSEHPFEGFWGASGSCVQLSDLQRLERENISRTWLEIWYRTAFAEKSERVLHREEQGARTGINCFWILCSEKLYRSSITTEAQWLAEKVSLLKEEMQKRTALQQYTLHVTAELFSYEPIGRLEAATTTVIRSEACCRTQLVCDELLGSVVTLPKRRGQSLGVTRMRQFLNAAVIRSYYTRLYSWLCKKRVAKHTAATLQRLLTTSVRCTAFNKIRAYSVWRTNTRRASHLCSILLQNSNKAILRSCVRKLMIHVAVKQKQRAREVLCSTFQTLTAAGVLRKCYCKLHAHQTERCVKRSQHHTAARNMLMLSDRRFMEVFYRKLNRYMVLKGRQRVQMRSRCFVSQMVFGNATKHHMRRRYDSWKSWTLKRTRAASIFNTEIRAAESFLKLTTRGLIRRAFDKLLRYHTEQSLRRKEYSYNSSAASRMLQTSTLYIITTRYKKWLSWITLKWRKGVKLQRATAEVFLHQIIQTQYRVRYTKWAKWYAKKAQQAALCERLNGLTKNGMLHRVLHVLKKNREWKQKQKVLYCFTSSLAKNTHHTCLAYYYSKLRNFSAQNKKRAVLVLAFHGTTRLHIMWHYFAKWLKWTKSKQQLAAVSKVAHHLSISLERGLLRVFYHKLQAWGSKKQARGKLVDLLCNKVESAALRHMYHRFLKFSEHNRKKKHKNYICAMLSSSLERLLLKECFTKMLVFRARHKKGVVVSLLERGNERMLLRTCYNKLANFVQIKKQEEFKLKAARVLVRTSDRLMLGVYFMHLHEKTEKKRKMKYKAYLVRQLCLRVCMKQAFWKLCRYRERKLDARKKGTAIGTLITQLTLRHCYGVLKEFAQKEKMRRRQQDSVDLTNKKVEADKVATMTHCKLIRSEARVSKMRVAILTMIKSSATHTLLRACFQKLKLITYRQKPPDVTAPLRACTVDAESASRVLLQTAYDESILYLLNENEGLVRFLILGRETSQRAAITSGMAKALLHLPRKYMIIGQEADSRRYIMTTEHAVFRRHTEALLNRYHQHMCHAPRLHSLPSKEDSQFRQLAQELSRHEDIERRLENEEEHHYRVELVMRWLMDMQMFIKEDFKVLCKREETIRSAIMKEEGSIRILTIEKAEEREREQVKTASKKREKPYVGLEVVDGMVRLKDGTTNDYLPSGCKVRSVKGPSLESGIIEGDVILAVDTIPIGSLADFRKCVLSLSPGDIIQVTYSRRSQQYTVSIRVGTAGQYGKDGQWQAGQRQTHAVKMKFKAPV